VLERDENELTARTRADTGGEVSTGQPGCCSDGYIGFVGLVGLLGVSTAGAAAGPAPLLTEPACENVTTPPGRLQTVCALFSVVARWASVFACEVLMLQTAPATEAAVSRLAFCRILTLPMARSTACDSYRRQERPADARQRLRFRRLGFHD